MPDSPELFYLRIRYGGQTLGVRSSTDFSITVRAIPPLWLFG